jgi:hypothetical protein
VLATRSTDQWTSCWSRHGAWKHRPCRRKKQGAAAAVSTDR